MFNLQEKRILIIHPYDHTTLFLETINNKLKLVYEHDLHYFKIETNDNSHNLCIQRIVSHPSEGLIVFLGHGRSNALNGSRGDEFFPGVEFEDSAAFPDLYYFKEQFISKINVHVFRGKKVFCLACNSNDKIADYAMEKGAVTFLGFGNIPTSKEEFIADGINNPTLNLINAMKSELNYIISRSLEYGISKSYNFEQLFNLIHFITNQRITDYLINQKNDEDRYILTDYLYLLKKEIKIFGDKKIKLIE